MTIPLGLQCPRCAQIMGTATTCTKCGFQIAANDGIVDLRVDPDFNTLLDVEAYEASHQFVDVNTRLATLYTNLMERSGRKPQGRVLELAAGSGNLTLGLLHSGCFDQVAASDISPEFLKILSNRHLRNQSNTRLDRFLFDANTLPFENEQFDFVVGNSVLHHFARFENTLTEASRVLKKGGVAIFGEPIIDTHAYTSLVAGIVLRWHETNPVDLPDVKSIQALRALQGLTVRKMQNLNSDRAGLANTEDKFLFPIAYLRSMTSKFGFTEFHVDEYKIPDLGSLVRKRISSILAGRGGDPSILARFDYVFDAMDHDYSAPLAPYMSPFFSLFAYVK